MLFAANTEYDWDRTTMQEFAVHTPPLHKRISNHHYACNKARLKRDCAGKALLANAQRGE